MSRPLDNFLPIRRILVDGVVTQSNDGGLVRDIDLVGDSWGVTLANEGRTLQLSGAPRNQDFSEEFSSTVVLDRGAHQVFNGLGDAEVTLTLGTGHVEGVSKTLFFGSEFSGSIDIDPDLHVSGDPFIPGAGYVLVIRYVNGVAYSVGYSLSRLEVRASGDTTGTKDTARLISAFASVQSGEVVRLSGVLYVRDPIDIQDWQNVDVEALQKGGAEIRLGTLWSGTGAESINNYVFRIVPTALAPTTTITSTREPTALSIDVGSASGFTVGTLYAVRGTANDFYDASGGIEEELLKVGSIVGTTLTHAWPQRGYHGATRTVTRYTNVSDGVRFRGIRFDLYATAGKYAAGAIYARLAKDVSVDECSFKGATWQAYYFDACRDGGPRDGIDLGGNNAAFDFNSCQNMLADNIFDRHEVHERKSSKGGKARWFFSTRNKSRNLVFSRLRASHANGLLRAWGSLGCRFQVYGSDLDGTLIKTDAPDDVITTPHGIALDTGANDLSVAEFTQGTDYDVQAVQVFMGANEDFATPIAYMYPAFYLHDTLTCRARLTCWNKAQGAFSTRDLRLGINVTDATGRVDVQVSGARIGQCTNNNFANITGNAQFIGTSATGTAGGYAFGALNSDLAPCWDTLDYGGDWSFGFFASHASTISTYSLRFPFARVFTAQMTVLDTPLGGYVPTPAGARFEWHNVLIARMPDSTANWGNNDRYRRIGRVFPMQDTTANVRVLVDTPAAATPRPMVGVDQCPNDAGGVERIMLVCEGGASFYGMVRVPAVTLSARARIESNATGECIAQGAFAPDALVSRTSMRVVVAGHSYIQCSGG